MYSLRYVNECLLGKHWKPDPVDKVCFCDRPSAIDKSAESIKRLLENHVVKVGRETIQTTADAIEERLEVNTPKQTGKTAKSWTQEKQGNGDIHIVTRLKTKKGFQPTCYLLELNYCNANQPPTMFIEKSITEGLQDAMGPSKKIG